MGNRIARIQNETPWLISMKELRMLGASTSLYGYTVQVNPYDSTEIPASLFLNRNHQYGMPSEIVIFTNGAEVRRSLISQDFVRYVKIILSVEGPYLVVRGVLPQVLDICWFWGCGFLGREYSGRQGVTIMKCRISRLLEAVPHTFLLLTCVVLLLIR